MLSKFRLLFRYNRFFSDTVKVNTVTNSLNDQSELENHFAHLDFNKIDSLNSSQFSKFIHSLKGTKVHEKAVENIEDYFEFNYGFPNKNEVLKMMEICSEIQELHKRFMIWHSLERALIPHLYQYSYQELLKINYFHLKAKYYPTDEFLEDSKNAVMKKMCTFKFLRKGEMEKEVLDANDEFDHLVEQLTHSNPIESKGNDENHKH